MQGLGFRPCIKYGVTFFRRNDDKLDHLKTERCQSSRFLDTDGIRWLRLTHRRLRGSRVPMSEVGI